MRGIKVNGVPVKGCGLFLVRIGLYVLIGFNAPWWVTVLSVLLAIEWSFTTNKATERKERA